MLNMRSSTSLQASPGTRCTAHRTRSSADGRSFQHSQTSMRHSQRRVYMQAQQAQVPPPRKPQGRTGNEGTTYTGNQENQRREQQLRQPDQQYSQSWNGQQQQQNQYPPPPSTSSPPPPEDPPAPKGPLQDFLSSYAKALIAAAFVAGLGLGVYFDSEVVLSPNNISSTEIIDRNTPNADVCMAYGYSASVFNMKLFVTYNPFNVYVTQPAIQSGCVLRRSNVGVLEQAKVVTAHDVDVCKSRMNTFAFTGDLKDSPDVACVYHSEEAENQYLQMTKGMMGKPNTAPSPAGESGSS